MKNEGYLLIDHRNSPGLPEAAAHALGVPAGSVTFECGILTCNHCQRGVILNPDRTRERGFCPKCSKYICDLCNLARVQTGECNPIAKQVDEAQEQVARDMARGSILLATK